MRSDWGLPTESIQNPNESKYLLSNSGILHNPNSHLVVANAVLLVRGAQGDRWNDRASAGVGVRPNVHCPGAKALLRLLELLDAIRMDISVRK